MEIWSDVVCPWCYIGKQRFAAALEAFPHGDDVEVRYRSFQLDPTATSDRADEPGVPHAERLAAKFGTDTAQVDRMHADMARLGAADGIDFHFDDVRSADTVDAHRLLHLAAELGVQSEVNARFFRAVFTDGEAMGDPTTLRRVAVDAGLPAAEVDDVLAGDRYRDAVTADLEQARAYGISGVPYFVLDGRYGVSGAQSVDVLTGALEQAYAERTTSSA
ncbi:DsbA family oxidoreductase [Jatrophihabitans sp. YIM 134969]